MVVHCVLSPDLPSNHPPTLFLHGELDPIVPIFTMWDYYDALTNISIPTKAVVYDIGTHQWIPNAPTEVSLIVLFVFFKFSKKGYCLV